MGDNAHGDEPVSQAEHNATQAQYARTQPVSKLRIQEAGHISPRPRRRPAPIDYGLRKEVFMLRPILLLSPAVLVCLPAAQRKQPRLGPDGYPEIKPQNTPTVANDAYVNLRYLPDWRQRRPGRPPGL